MCIARSLIASLLIATSSFTAAALGQNPGTLFTYQGELQDPGGPANGLYDMRFQLWLSQNDPDNPIGPVVCKDNVPVTDGIFTTQLDFGPSVIIGFPLWLGIEVRTDSTLGNCTNPLAPPFTALTPRQSLTPAPYAVWATTAQTAGLRLPFDGTSASGVLLHLTNTSNAQNTSTGFFENHSTGNNSRAITAIANGSTGLTYAVYGQCNSTNGRGVFGTAGGTAGVNYGGYFEAAGGNGYGVFGHATALGTANYGVYGRSDSENGHAVHGYAAADSGINTAVYGRTDSTTGRAVFGEAIAATGTTTYGGRFSSLGTSGYGVYGVAGAATGTTYGVYGRSNSSGGFGVYGQGAEDGTGVYGVASGGEPFSSSIAIYGEIVNGSPAFSYAGFFDGNAKVTENMTVVESFVVGGTKSFKIDHPADPTNKYLVHYCTEAPEPLNVYRGNVVLDSAGRASIELPGYFAEINRDVSYTLTPVGAAAPDLHVAHEVRDNRFEIAGGQPGQKVSWRVEAVRNDPWVRTHGAPVEVDKPEHERGKYQHPELYGQPQAMGVSHRKSE